MSAETNEMIHGYRLELDDLIHGYRLELATPECLPTATSWGARVRLEEDITQVLPYLNASLKNGDYNHNAKILLWDNGGRKYAFRPYEIAIAPVEDREEAQAIADGVIGMVNDVWNRRHEIEPDLEGKRPPPNLLDIYRLLPGTNCRECGYSTCMAYATDLRKGKAELAQCPHLSQQAYADNRVRLSGILQPTGG
jgi:ArsR family metal-binding transcriptional regulator